jgi:hypothetical protein
MHERFFIEKLSFLISFFVVNVDGGSALNTIQNSERDSNRFNDLSVVHHQPSIASYAVDAVSRETGMIIFN